MSRKRMESNEGDDTRVDESDYGATESKNWFSEMLWKDVKYFSHEYLVTFPKDLTKDEKIECQLPYPVFDPTQNLDTGGYWKPIIPKTLKPDSRWLFYKKLYAGTKKKVLLTDLDENIVELPRYIVDLASGALDDNTEVWSNTGGNLDCVDFNGVSYLANLIAPHEIRFAQWNGDSVSSTSTTVNVEKSSSIYNIKCGVNAQSPTLAIRQLDTITLFQPFESNNVNCSPLWSIESTNPLIDMQFNSYHDHQFCCINTEHTVVLFDFNKKTKISKHTFPLDNDSLIDSFAQILFLDSNTLVQMDRSCIYFLDFRSGSVNRKCLKKWLDCDELCTLSKKNDNVLYITSMHNIIEFDLKSLTSTGNVVHMMSTYPFISSVVEQLEGHYLCLLGQDINDMVLTSSNKANTMRIPQRVSNIKDTFRITSSTTKLNYLDLLEERLTLPLIGMKLHKDVVTNDVVLFTSNSVGDVFQQKISQAEFEWKESIDRLAKWINKLSLTPRSLEVTSITNLARAFNSITTELPEDKTIKSLLMNDDTAQSFYDKNINSIQKDIESVVGQSINAIWPDEVVEENGLSTQDKVMEWLHE